jgi:putative MATE family efflux protein
LQPRKKNRMWGMALNSVAPSPVVKPLGVYQFLKDALLGTRLDFTSISIDRAILLLALPTVVVMGMESLFGIVDTFFVAHLGADATATVGITEGMLVLIFALAAGLSMAAGALIARRVGEQDMDGAAEAAVQSIILVLTLSIVVFAVCFGLSSRLLLMMGASPGIMQVGALYTRIMMSASGVILILFLMNAIFRGAGDAAIAMQVLWLANFINIVLDPCLILGLGPFPKLGVTGAAVATTTGRSIGILFQIYMLWKNRGRIAIRRKHLRINFKVMASILRLAGSGAMQFVVATASWAGMVRMIQIFGSAATAGYTVAIRIVFFSILPAWGLGNAAATLVGQNLGAKHPDRAEYSVWRAGFFNMVYLGAVSMLFLLFAPRLVSIFSNDIAVIGFGAGCLRIISACYVLYAYGMVIIQALNGAGDTRSPLAINLLCYWAVQLPLAFFLSRYTALGTNGIYVAAMITQILLALVAIYAFRRGLWKTRTL